MVVGHEDLWPVAWENFLVLRNVLIRHRVIDPRPFHGPIHPISDLWHEIKEQMWDDINQER